jgi:hypothetical protein
MPNRLEKALRRQDKDKQDKKVELSGTLGIVVNGNQVVDVPGRAGFAYVLLNSKEQELIQAFNDKVSSLFGLSVIVVWNKTRYEVLRKDDIRYGTWNSNYLPKHGNQHSFNPDGGGGGDVTYIYGKQFVPLSLTPSGQFGAPVAIVAPYSQLNSGWHYIDSTTTPNITAHRPTDNQAKMVLVCLDWATQTPQLIIGTGTFSASLTGSADVIPYLPSTTGVYQVPIAGVRLVSGTTAVTWQNIYDVRQFFHPVFTGTASSGGGSSIDTIGFAGQDEGINLGTGTVLNVVGAGATFTRSGTVFNLSIPGGGSIDTGTLNSLYLRLDASNDPLTGQLIINPSSLPSIDAAALVINISGSASNFPSQMYGAAINNRHGGGVYAKGFSNLTTASINQSASTGTTINSSVLTLDRRPEDLSYTTFSAPLIDVTERPISGAITGPLFRYRSVLTQRVLINPNATGTNTNVSFDSNNALEPTGKILELLNAGSSRFYVNASGTAYSNGSPLIKEAPVDGNSYVRKNAGWELGQGGGGGGIGFVGWDEGIYLGTGTILNVTGDGATLSFSGTVFNLSVPVRSLDDLSDVMIFNLADEDILVYNSTSGAWINTQPLDDAPFDGTVYGRVTGSWTPITQGGGGGGNVVAYDDSVFVATGTKISFNKNLNVYATGTSVFVEAPVTTYFRVGVPTQVNGNFWQVPDRVYASGSLGVFNNGMALLINSDYAEQLWVSGTYQYLSTFTGTHMVFYGVPCSPQTQPSTGTGEDVSGFALQDSDSELLLDSDSVQLLDSDGA